MAVQMEGMFARVVVIQDDFDRLILAEDIGVCVDAVDERVGG